MTTRSSATPQEEAAGAAAPSALPQALANLLATARAGLPLPHREDAGAPRPRLPLSVVSEITVASITMLADHAGALFWPDEGLLVVADLHFEKGSSYADRGVLLPPYDTAATLGRLGALIDRYQPRAVFALGDSFHDGGGPARLSDADRATLTALQRGRTWIWIAGNHDPHPAVGIGGDFAATLGIGSLIFRHEPSREAVMGEIAGHLHPVARVNRRGRSVSRRCFAADGRRIVVPAFGAYAGGLNIRARPFAELFDDLSFIAHMLGDHRLFAIPAHRCAPD